MKSQRKLLCIFAPSFDEGGVERMLANLAAGLCSQGIAVHFLTDNPESHYLNSLLSQGVIKSLKGVQRKDLTNILAKYLSEQRPSWILSSKDGANKIAYAAKQKAACHSRLAFRVATTHSERIKTYVFPKRWIKLLQIQKLYKKADLLIAVSKGVAEDVSKITNVSQQVISIIPNPVVTDQMIAQANETIEHQWFSSREQKCTILGVGRFSRAKDFPNLIHAFAKVKKKRVNAKLLILGEGRQRSRIERTARDLGIREHVSLPGYAPNPYPFFAKADIFVLSSIWEGLPGALIEALALGTPVVSTDCPSGPREILQNGRYGYLVPPRDSSALAAAILKTLANPPPASVLRHAASPYHVKQSTLAYMDAMGLLCNNDEGPIV
ncbi:MAG: glycosyltransferase [Deltaproteobacteria bacterium]|nr:glycosyltransferase [Deltaproteobacteria bacterium]